MTGLESRVLLHWQRKGMKHELKMLSSEQREERRNGRSHIKVVSGKSGLLELTEMSFIS